MRRGFLRIRSTLSLSCNPALTTRAAPNPSGLVRLAAASPPLSPRRINAAGLPAYPHYSSSFPQSCAYNKSRTKPFGFGAACGGFAACPHSGHKLRRKSQRLLRRSPPCARGFAAKPQNFTFAEGKHFTSSESSIFHLKIRQFRSARQKRGEAFSFRF